MDQNIAPADFPFYKFNAVNDGDPESLFMGVIQSGVDFFPVSGQSCPDLIQPDHIVMFGIRNGRKAVEL